MIGAAVPTKKCAKCKRRKPWTDYWAKTKWPDGTMRQPQSWCKTCHAERTPNPEVRQRANQRYWAKYKRDREAYTDHLERRRFRYHIARGTSEPVRSKSKDQAPRLRVAPFAAWLRTLGTNSVDIAKECGLNDRQVRMYLSESRDVLLDVADRALLYASTTTRLEDLWPELNH